MIAVASSGRRFANLLRYLERGRDGASPERVDWVAARNLIDEDPRVASLVMQATAGQNPRVTRPVYHLAVSFHPDDVVTRETMERVADRLLRELGLAERQVLIVAHADRPHAHVHLVVNRIHPETGIAWDRWQDRVTTQRVLREEERALGLHEVKGRLYQLPGQELAERTVATRGEHRTAGRMGEEPLLPGLRAHLAEYRRATTWAELETQLAVERLRFERKGQGLVITDGERAVKASRVARDFSFARLEARLGPYDRAPAIDGATLDERTATVIGQVRAAERSAQLGDADYRAGNDVARVEGYLERITWSQERAKALGGEFDRALAQLYVKPRDARALFESAVAARGREAAVRHLAEHPGAYGALRPMTRPMLKIFRVADDRNGAARANVAAREGERAVTTARELRAAILNAPPGIPRPHEGRTDWYVYAVTHGRERLRHAMHRVHRLRQREPHELIGRSTLPRELVKTVQTLAPRELQQAMLWLTSPQAALLQSARNAARQVALGVER